VLRWFYAALIAAWCALLGIMWGSPAGSTAPLPTDRREPVAEKHYVTARQLAASGAWRGRPIAAFSTRVHDGTRLESTDLTGKRPAVLVFIKKGCPCSAEFEPFFHRLERRYRGLVRFFGVIDGNRDVARRYAKANKVPYPVVADPGLSVVRRFKAENGGYVVLLTRAGVVDTLWPGLSAEMMRQLGRRVAALARVGERPLDLRGLPAVLTTGCPYEP
jgi:peroxiredoxin